MDRKSGVRWNALALAALLFAARALFAYDVPLSAHAVR